MSENSKDKKKWGGFGKMLHKDRPTSTNTSNTSHDSTYGTEASQRDSYNSSAPSMISDSSSAKPSSDLSNKDDPTATKQVVNEDGHVVTTTTTTTTTTTSTGRGNSSSKTSMPHSSGLANKLDPRVDSDVSGNKQQKAPEPVSGTGTGIRAPNIPQRSELRQPSPQPPMHRQSGQPQPAPSIHDVRDGRTTSNTYAAGTSGGPQVNDAGGPNFSYPGRSGPAGSTAPGTSRQGPGTLQGIKAAAAGIHGAGETLRGTLNSTVDRRFNAPPEKIAAHNQVAKSGRQEIETGHFSHQHAPSQHAQHQQQQQQQQAYPAGPPASIGGGTGSGTGAGQAGRASTNPLKGILRKSEARGDVGQGQGQSSNGLRVVNE